MGKRHKQRKLKNYLFVNKAQIIIGVSNLILLLLMTGLMIVAVLSPLYADIFQSGDIYLQNVSSKIFILLLERLAIIFAILFVILFLHQSLVVHKICGPLESFKLTFDKLRAGDFARKINLRQRDLFKPEADQINEVLENLSALLSSLRSHHQGISTDLDKASKETGPTPELHNILNSIADRNQASMRELSKIKVIELNGRDS